MLKLFYMNFNSKLNLLFSVFFQDALCMIDLSKSGRTQNYVNEINAEKAHEPYLFLAIL